jgi:uncharacterized RDD family membrane protein YckC
MPPVANPTQVIGRRVLAFLIDFLITGVFYWGLFFVFAGDAAPTGTSAVQAMLNTTDGAYLRLGDGAWAITGGEALLFFGIFLVVGLLYWVVLQGVTGTTLGKAVTGIRTVRREYGRPGVGRALVRQVVGIVDYFPYILLGLVGFVLSLTTRGNRRLGDMAAGTYVVRRGATPAQPHAQPAAATPAGPAAPTAGLEANWYPDPYGEARLRYWDGRSWTDRTSD